MSFTSETATEDAAVELARVAAREARSRARKGTCALAGGLFGLGSRLGGRRRLLVVVEDFVAAFAFEQGLELLGVDRLALEQQLRDLLELGALFAQQALRGLVGALDHAADLVIDLASDLVGVIRLGGEFATEEPLGPD